MLILPYTTLKPNQQPNLIIFQAQKLVARSNILIGRHVFSIEINGTQQISGRHRLN